MKKILAMFAFCAVLGVTMAACGKVPMAPATDAKSAANLYQDAAARGGLEASGRPEVFAAAGDIRSTIEAYRTALGTLNPNQPGSFGAGRREINWDAVPAQFTNIDNFPADFFNQPVVGRARGALFTTPGTGFRVSDDNFVGLNPTYRGEFNFFSPVRTFIAVGDPSSAVEFFVPGTQTPAASTGFGVVFSDVDHLGSASIRLFDAEGRSLGTFLAPADPGGLSFVGVRYAASVVARVEILSGKAALGPDSFDISSDTNGPTHDLVIMDDFLYGEPIAIGAQAPSSGASLASANPTRRGAPSDGVSGDTGF